MRREVDTTIKSVSDDFEESTMDNYHMIDSDDAPTLTKDLLGTLAEDEWNGEYDGLANTEINCHKCLRASFNFKKVNFCVHLVFYFIFHFLRLTFVQNVRNMECLRKKICSQITATNAQDLNTIKSIPIIVRRDAMLFWRTLMKTRPPLLKLKQRRLFLIWDLWEIFLERSLWLLPINILSIDKSN